MLLTKPSSRLSTSGTWISLELDKGVRLLDIRYEGGYLKEPLNACIVAYNKCGGLIAIYCKDAVDALEAKEIYLYNSMLQPHKIRSCIKVEHNVLFMCWNDLTSHLIVVLSNKSIHFFNYRGEPASVSIFIETIPQSFISTDTGLAGLIHLQNKGENLRSSLLVLFYLECGNYAIKTIDLPSIFQNVIAGSAMLVVPPQKSGSGFAEIFFQTKPSPPYSDICHCILSPTPRCSNLNISFSGACIKHFSLSEDGSSVCFLLEDGSIYYTNTNFRDIAKVGHVEVSQVSQLAWCGKECIACLTIENLGDYNTATSGVLLLMNPDDPEVTDCIYDLPTDALLLQECDGLRLIGTNFYKFLQLIPIEIRRVFAVGSRAYSAVLLSTYDDYIAGNAGAVIIARELQQNADALVEAVNDCIVASTYELDVVQQKRLLRVAAFGRSLCSVCGSDFFISTAQKLRIRNSLNKSSAGMLLTHEQLYSLGQERLLGRLLCCDEYQIAYSICNSLGIERDRVLNNWALAMLSKHKLAVLTEKKAANLIVQKLKTFERPLFSELARLARMNGYRDAALIFLSAEANPSRRVLMFLSIGDSELALESALATGDTDLIFTVVLHLIESDGVQWIPLLTAHKESRALLFQYTFANRIHRNVTDILFDRNPRYQTFISFRDYFLEEKLLKISFENSGLQDGVQFETLQERKGAAAKQILRFASRENDQAEVVNTSHSFSTLFSPLSTPSGSVSLPNSNVKFLRTHLSVIEEQTHLMKELNDARFLSASVLDMIRLVFEYRKISIANKLKSKFNVPDKAFQWCMLSAFSKTNQWALVDEVGMNSRVQPLIKPEHFINTLLSSNRLEQAKQYIPRVPIIERRLEYYVLCGDWLAAGADCRSHGDTNLLLQLKERAKGNEKILEQIDQGWKQQQRTVGLNLTKLFI